ncbi:MAG: cytochrome c3 family protein [Planctomycetaceae bacterium]
MITRESVAAPIDGRHLESHGWRCRFYYDGDQLRVSMQDRLGLTEMLKTDSDGPVQRGLPLDRPVVMSTGSHHMQLYWIAVDSVLFEVPFYYRIADQMWVPKEDTFLRAPAESTLPEIWNGNCIECHSVAGQPRGQVSEGDFDTQVAEVGIACEACHGPAEAHVRFYSAAAKIGGSMTNAPENTIVNPARCAPEVATHICAHCHSHSLHHDPAAFAAEGSQFRPGNTLDQTRVVSYFDDAVVDHHQAQTGGRSLKSLSDEARTAREQYLHDGYWPDGTTRVGGDEFLGLVVSKCYTDGDLSCLSCHSMHQSDPNDQLASGMETDQACLQCHTEFKNSISSHTHHPAGSGGSRCYNCHMPHTTYALLTAMRSHRIDSPQAAPASGGGRPNACNLCHLDKTLQWTSDRLTEWYGTPLSTDLDEHDHQVAASVLWLLKGNIAQRAVSAWHMGWEPAHAASGNRWQAAFLARTLNDPVSAVRYVAGRAIGRLPGFENFKYSFVADESQRAQAERTAVDLWMQQHDTDPPSGDPTLLIGSGGRVDEERVRELISRQDTTLTNLPE